jgi:putative restriction endonuclease
MAYWWVNQNQTFEYEIAGGYMWSPKRKKNGDFNRFYENMRVVDTGDVIFSFYARHIQKLGIVMRPAIASPKPTEFGNAGANWSKEGWLVPVEWHDVQRRIRPRDIINELREVLPERHGPLKKTVCNMFIWLLFPSKWPTFSWSTLEFRTSQLRP